MVLNNHITQGLPISDNLTSYIHLHNQKELTTGMFCFLVVVRDGREYTRNQFKVCI